MSGSGRGDKGKHRRPFKGRGRDNQAFRDNSALREQPVSMDNRRLPVQKADSPRIPEPHSDKNTRDRPQWTPPKVSTEALPVLECLYCSKPIKDIATAISDKNSGKAVHFDCVIARISQNEKLEHGETISYIGGGRFGIVKYNNPSGNQGLSIKKIFEWAIRENRAEWRQTISDHYSVT